MLSSLHLCCCAGKQESGGHGDIGSRGCSAEPLDLFSSSYKVASGKWKSSQALVVFPTSFPFKMTTALLNPQEGLESLSLSSLRSNGRTLWRRLDFPRQPGRPQEACDRAPNTPLPFMACSHQADCPTVHLSPPWPSFCNALRGP